MRQYGSLDPTISCYVRRPGVYAILPKSGRLLVTFQAGVHNEFQLPGGGVDKGESSLAALHREVWEETGWRISSPRFFRRFKRYAYMPEYDLWAEKICTIYIARPIRELNTPIEPQHSAHWVNPNEIAPLLSNLGDRSALAAFNRSYSPT